MVYHGPDVRCGDSPFQGVPHYHWRDEYEVTPGDSESVHPQSDPSTGRNVEASPDRQSEERRMTVSKVVFEMTELEASAVAACVSWMAHYGHSCEKRAAAATLLRHSGVSPAEMSALADRLVMAAIDSVEVEGMES